jgi:prevent-host-death family protein
VLTARIEITGLLLISGERHLRRTLAGYAGVDSLRLRRVVRFRLSEIAEEVDRAHERVHITRNGREYVVLIASEDLESIEATLNCSLTPPPSSG